MRHYTSTELIVREDILQKAKELAALISTSEEVLFYKKAERQIQENDRTQELIKAIKKKQKEVVAFESFENPEMVKKIEAEQQGLQDELDGIPIVEQFKQSQTDLNQLLQLVVSVMRDSVTEKIQLDDELGIS